MEDLTSQLQGMFQQLSGGRRRAQKMKVSEAVKLLTEEEAGKLLNDEEIKARALASAEQNGIVFLDEIDKIASREGMQGVDVSRQGVQRDLLPLVEGTTVTTKYGMLRTDHVLFIASGAFHLSKPSDLIPELQGRFPIRVELSSLSVEDFEKILIATDACLTRQYEALLATENVHRRVPGRTASAGSPRSRIAVNEKQENIGARRLYTVMERLLEDVSFHASKFARRERRDRRGVRRRAARGDRGRRRAGEVHPVGLGPIRDRRCIGSSLPQATACRSQRSAARSLSRPVDPDPSARTHPRDHPPGVLDHRARLLLGRGA